MDTLFKAIKSNSHRLIKALPLVAKRVLMTQIVILVTASEVQILLLLMRSGSNNLDRSQVQVHRLTTTMEMHSQWTRLQKLESGKKRPLVMLRL